LITSQLKKLAIYSNARSKIDNRSAKKNLLYIPTREAKFDNQSSKKYAAYSNEKLLLLKIL
jgi:hypothetical protein